MAALPTSGAFRDRVRRAMGTPLGRRAGSTALAHRLGWAPNYPSTALDLLHDVIPDDVAKQVHAGDYIDLMADTLHPGATVLDLGCGVGKTKRQFRDAEASLRWVGIDIPDSPESESRPNGLSGVASFDGLAIPVGRGLIDCVYSRHVMEHVRHPATLLDEVRRVLRPNGWFTGVTSNLEPYHSFSYWNFTPYGFRALLDAAGLELIELRPGIDGRTLIERSLYRQHRQLGRFFGETSPVNAEIIKWGERAGHRPAVINERMLQFCGHFGFVARAR